FRKNPVSEPQFVAKKPGFLPNLRVKTQDFRKNPVSEPQFVAKKPGFLPNLRVKTQDFRKNRVSEYLALESSPHRTRQCRFPTDFPKIL
ncbi:MULTISPECIES: hypothetical protein, partial [unclassified Microcoleus]